ncbi:MAG: hypothetical protein EU530_07180 [Promethearchaeota archaeon]|nr:MAG: hypothetical protein EU530_07180 [Candidatus Lokiarchaeota archaeon]
METTNKAPMKLVDDLKQYDLIHPKPHIKDNLSQLKLPDLAIRPIEPPEPVIPSSLDPSKQIINSKRDLLNKDDLQLGTEIIDPKKKYLMKK